MALFRIPKLCLSLVMLGVLLVACAEPATGPAKSARILAMGDSMLAWNGGGVADEVERRLGEEVVDRSVSGARMLFALPISGSLGFRISKQYVASDWDWVILNGGGNDLWLGCGCTRCDAKINQLISPDGKTGEVPDLVRRIRAQGSKVLMVGYLRTPGRDSPIDHCREIGDTYEGRLSALAKQSPDVEFLSNKGLVPNGDLSFHSLDRIHPSLKGSAAIGARIARIIDAGS